MLRIVAVVQARLGSERLPGKVMADIAGRPMLTHVLDAVRRVPRLDGVLLAVPAHDQELVALGHELGVPVYEHLGDESDVLARYVGAAHQAQADAVVRITADCPLLDPLLVDQAVSHFRRWPCDYLYVTGYPRGVGDAEVLGVTALERAGRLATTARDREHVVTYLLWHPMEYSQRLLRAPDDLWAPELRVCVDEPADLEVVRWLVAHVPPPRDVRQIIRALDAHPEIRAINDPVEQRS